MSDDCDWMSDASERVSEWSHWGECMSDDCDESKWVMIVRRVSEWWKRGEWVSDDSEDNKWVMIVREWVNVWVTRVSCKINSIQNFHPDSASRSKVSKCAMTAICC